MNYQSFYQKYRPKTFKEVIGQEYVTRILINSIKNKMIANAYVFAGSKGTGKTSIARIFANAINCLNFQDDICKKCEICLDFAKQETIDVIELDGASHNGVDDIRQINDNIQFLPIKLAKKVYIIDEAHMLTIQAWNALLKNVEEPPNHIVFIFATTEIHKIPETILSRCICLKFNKISCIEIEKFLEIVCKKEKIKYSSPILKNIATLANGSVRDSLRILEQLSIYDNNDLNIDSLYQIYGLLTIEEMITFINHLVGKNTNDALLSIEQYLKNGINLIFFVTLILEILTDKLIYLSTENEKLLSHLTLQNINSVKINEKELTLNLLDLWQKVYAQLLIPNDTSIILKNAIIQSTSLIKKEKVINKEKKLTISFKTEEIFYDKQLFISKKTLIKNNCLDDNKEILLSIVANKDIQAISQAQQILMTLKNENLQEKNFNYWKTAKQVFCASKNGIILAFNDEIDAKLLNKNNKNYDFLLSCFKLFKQPKYIIGYSIKQLNDLKEEIKKNINKKNQDVSIESLEKILNSNQTIEQIAYKTFFKTNDNDK